MVVGAVKRDVNDIGKNLVITMFERVRFEVGDLGIDFSLQKFVESIQKHKPQLVAISVLLRKTMRELKIALDAIAKAGLKNQVKTIVEGVLHT